MDVPLDPFQCKTVIQQASVWGGAVGGPVPQTTQESEAGELASYKCEVRKRYRE